MNLLSITHLTKVSAKVRFTENKCEILNPNDELIGIAHFSNGLFRLPCTIMGIEHAYITKHSGEDHGVDAAHVVCMTTASASIDTWHVHLRHISINSIFKMMWSGMVKGMHQFIVRNVKGQVIPNLQSQRKHLPDLKMSLDASSLMSVRSKL